MDAVEGVVWTSENWGVVEARRIAINAVTGFLKADEDCHDDQLLSMGGPVFVTISKGGCWTVPYGHDIFGVRTEKNFLIKMQNSAALSLVSLSMSDVK